MNKAEQSAKSLAENAKELESAKEKSRVKFEEVQLFTGEEGEENVLQVRKARLQFISLLKAQGLFFFSKSQICSSCGED